MQLSIGEAVDLRDALTELTDKQKTAIHLYAQGYTQQEIAAKDGVQRSAICRRLSRAVRRIRVTIGVGM